MDDDKTASQKMLDEVRKKYRAWRTTPGSGKAVAQAAFVEAVARQHGFSRERFNGRQAGVR